ncbi:uncharacterized protein A1O9_05939 [Exophiala aquamarina CBS 119918]|uniref:Uncharacterized protein n=1 Tax=Exophiala aquamarina CBS 119918 TaxID=1182545 RepID=A0A072PDS2_9EURO|nr:uncharacterized protein A1O9_05939 [Exophiala aquamarina CBS 119918]KEF58016.1 hypothetical protein A1O9_05939 [Exophiala aquamarina CBS 119918]
MDHPIPLGPQPDFNLLGQHLISAGDEIKKAQNLPTITIGERILAELQQLRQDGQQMRQEFKEATQAIRQDLATMMTASNHNNAARVQNSYLTDRSNSLLPFLNPLTGAIIAGFPTTPAEIERMDEQEVDRVSQQLGVQALGLTMTLAAKRRQLRAHIGLKAQSA